MRTPYHIFLTPDGDTRGLYVTEKTPTGFMVSETQGGRGSFAFDFRIIGSAAGGTGERMTSVTPAVAARFFPMLSNRRPTNGVNGLTHRPRYAPHPKRRPRTIASEGCFPQRSGGPSGFYGR